MAKRYSDTDKYNKHFIRDLPGPYKLLFDYLNLNCDYCGIWDVNFPLAQLQIGQDMPVDKNTCLQLFNMDETRIVEFDNGRKWFFPKFIEFQYTSLDSTERVRKKVKNVLIKYDLLTHLGDQRVDDGSLYVSNGSKDKDKEQDEDKEKDSDDDLFEYPKLDFVNPNIPAAGRIKFYFQEKNQIWGHNENRHCQELVNKIKSVWRKSGTDPTQDQIYDVFEQMLNSGNWHVTNNHSVDTFNFHFNKIITSIKDGTNDKGGNQNKGILDQAARGISDAI